MRLAYLITTYGQYEHLHRLIAALDDPCVHFYIHVDAKAQMPTNLGDFQRITMIERRKIWWAGWSIVEAELALMRAAVADGGYDYYALISGQDYPFRPNAWLRERLAQGGEFIGLSPLPSELEGRMNYRYFEGFDRRNRRSLGYLTMRGIERLLALVAPKRRWPVEQIWKGDQWGVLSDECVRHVLQQAVDKRLVDFFKTSFAPDESFIQTIIGNSPFAAQVRPGPTYADWSEQKSGPALITSAHLPAMAASGRFFARKFDDSSGEVIAQIDKTLRK